MHATLCDDSDLIDLLRRRADFAGGVLVESTRLLFDPVGNILRPGKAIVLVRDAFSLAKGKPKKVAWY